MFTVHYRNVPGYSYNILWLVVNLDLVPLDCSNENKVRDEGEINPISPPLFCPSYFMVFVPTIHEQSEKWLVKLLYGKFHIAICVYGLGRGDILGSNLDSSTTDNIYCCN